MRYLIVGGTSIFGEKLIDSLLSKSETELIVSTRLSEEAEFSRNNLVWEVLDLRNTEKTFNVVREAKADIVYDLATQDSVGFSWKHPSETVDVNVEGTINLMNAIREYSPGSRVIIGGSGEEYGQVDYDLIPIKESTRVYPNNIYGATKACQTMFAKLYHQAYGLDTVILRTFYETSEVQDDKFAISSFCKQFAEIEAGKQEPVIYTGNINNIRDFTDVDDLVRAFVLVAEKGKSGEVYNAARGEAHSLLDVINILKNLTGMEVTIRADAKRFRPMDSATLVADVKKIEDDCGWKAEIPFEVTIEKMLNSWRRRIQ